MSETVLIIDDEPTILGTVADVLADEGYRPLKATSGLEGLALFKKKKPDVVFLDIWLADRDGLEVLHALRDLDPNAAVIMISGHGTVSDRGQGDSNGGLRLPGKAAVVQPGGGCGRWGSGAQTVPGSSAAGRRPA